MSARSLVQLLERIGYFLEDALTVGLLGFMIVLASIQILLRNSFDLGFIWGDEALRILVLWVAMAGAVAASRADKHITIDVLSRFLSARVNHMIKTLTDVFTAGVSGFAAWYSWGFVSMEMEFDSRLLGRLPAWAFEIVLPIGFALISLCYMVHAAKSMTRVLSNCQDEDEA